MEDFSAGQARDANFEAGGLPDAAAPLDRPHADDNLGDEAPFPPTWQALACADAPRD